MFTYLKEDRILFTCDFLGSHYATSNLFVSSRTEIYDAAKRYYAEIMMSFRNNIKRHLIINAYRDWISDEVKNEVVLPFVSMHGSTREK